jgi:hypothetical protein
MGTAVAPVADTPKAAAVNKRRRPRPTVVGCLPQRPNLRQPIPIHWIMPFIRAGVLCLLLTLNDWWVPRMIVTWCVPDGAALVAQVDWAAFGHVGWGLAVMHVGLGVLLLMLLYTDRAVTRCSLGRAAGNRVRFRKCWRERGHNPRYLMEDPKVAGPAHERRLRELATALQEMNLPNDRGVIVTSINSMPPEVPDAPPEPVVVRAYPMTLIEGLAVLWFIPVALLGFVFAVADPEECPWWGVPVLIAMLVPPAVILIIRCRLQRVQYRVVPGRVERRRKNAFSARVQCDVWAVEPGTVFLAGGVEVPELLPRYDDVDVKASARIWFSGPAGVDSFLVCNEEKRQRVWQALLCTSPSPALAEDELLG